MAIPVLYAHSAFDSTAESVFTFSWSGSQAVKNRLKIFRNSDNFLVYDQTQTTFQLKHTVPTNTLVNGTVYNAEVYVFDSNNASSSPSAKILFWCYTTPSWSFSNLMPDQIINNTSYQLQLSYSQPEGELLNSYQVSLYDTNQSLLYQTGLLYNTENLTVTISGLNDNTQYYIRSTGKTLNGMDLDTGFIRVSVDYVSPSMFSLITLENLPNDGNIKITSNIISMIGKSLPDPPTYLNDNWVDLTVDGSKVWFDSEFEITKNFTLQMIGQNFTDYSIVLELSNGTYKVDLRYMRGTFLGQESEKAYFILNAYNSVTNYTLTSNYINVPLSTDSIHIWIRRINNIYELHIENITI